MLHGNNRDIRQSRVPSYPSFEFGVSEFTTTPWTFEQDVDHYSRLGVPAIEVCEVKLAGKTYGDALRHATESGLRISSVQPAVRTLFPSKTQPKPLRVAARIDLFRRTIDSFGEFAAGMPFVTNSGIAPGGNIQRLLDTAVEEYGRLAEFARDYGASIAFEPLNPVLMNLESAVWTIDQAASLAAKIQVDNFGICLDLWNVWQNPRVEEAIAEHGKHVTVIHIADWRVPRSDQDRLIPGDGEIPLDALLRAIRETGFTGAYSIEIFSANVPDPIWEQDLDTVITRSREGLEAAWERSAQ